MYICIVMSSQAVIIIRDKLIERIFVYIKKYNTYCLLIFLWIRGFHTDFYVLQTDIYYTKNEENYEKSMLVGIYELQGDNNVIL